MRRLMVFPLLAVLCLACGRKTETVSTSTATETSATTATTAAVAATATTATLPAHDADNLLSLASGAMVIKGAEPADANGAAWHMLDDDPLTGWASADGKFTEPTVIELADRSTIRTVSFDDARDEFDGRIPKHVTIEVSDTSATEGFKPVADITLPPEQKDGIEFPVTAQLPGRFVRLTVHDLYGSTGIGQIMEFRAFGDRLEHNPPPNVTGSYKTDGAGSGWMYLTQSGTQVTGCYENAARPLAGGLEGRILKFTWDSGDDITGPGIVIFSGNRVFGGYWKTTGVSAEHPMLASFEGTKTSDKPGPCPTDKKKPEELMAADIREKGRLRLYGINFDSDSAALRDESKPTLDIVASMLKANPDLKITIEGHTDTTSTAQHNQQLSEERAIAVKAYLAGAGVDAGRLSAAGFGATKPVATNDTPLGRSENRRVELVKG